MNYLKYLSENFGKVFYISPEEANSDTLDLKLDFYKISSDSNKFMTSSVDTLEEIENVIKEENPNFVII